MTSVSRRGVVTAVTVNNNDDENDDDEYRYHYGHHHRQQQERTMGIGGEEDSITSMERSMLSFQADLEALARSIDDEDRSLIERAVTITKRRPHQSSEEDYYRRKSEGAAGPRSTGNDGDIHSSDSDRPVSASKMGGVERDGSTTHLTPHPYRGSSVRKQQQQTHPLSSSPSSGPRGSRSSTSRAAARTALFQDQEPSPERPPVPVETPAPFLFSPDPTDGQTGGKEGAPSSLEWKELLDIMSDTMDRQDERIRLLELENEELRKQLMLVQQHEEDEEGYDGNYGGRVPMYGYYNDSNNRGQRSPSPSRQYHHRRRPVDTGSDSRLRRDSRGGGGSPGAKFVADLARLMDLDPKVRVPLTVVMDKHFRRRASSERSYYCDYDDEDSHQHDDDYGY